MSEPTRATAQHHRSSPAGSLAGTPGEEALVELALQALPMYSAQQESAEPLLVPPLLATLLSSPLTLAVLGSSPQPRVPQFGSQGSDCGLVVKPAVESTSYQNGGAMEPAAEPMPYQNGGAMEPALAERESEAAVASMTNATSAHDQRNTSADGQLSRRLAFERLAPAQYPTAAQEEHTRSWLETQQPSSSSSTATATDAVASGTGWHLRRGTDADPSTPGSVFHRRARDQLSREQTHSWLQDQQPSSSPASSAYAASSTGASEPATPESLFRRRAREQLSLASATDDVRYGAGRPASSISGSAHSWAALHTRDEPPTRSHAPQPSSDAAVPRRLVRRFSFASGEAAKLRAAKAWTEAAAAPPQPSSDVVSRRAVRRFSFASGEAANVRAAKARAEAAEAGGLKLDNGRKLFAAVQRGQLPLVREALRCAECDVNCHDHEHNTALHWAVKLDDAQALMLLLTPNPNPNPNPNPTPTPNPNPNQALILLLTHTDLDVNRANARGETALHLAATAGQHRLIRELWRQPALKPELRDKDGHTAHRLAVRGKHTELAKLLVRLYSTMRLLCVCSACAAHRLTALGLCRYCAHTVDMLCTRCAFLSCAGGWQMGCARQ